MGGDAPVFVSEVQGTSADALSGMAALADGEFDPQVFVRADFTLERPSPEVVGENLGSLPTDFRWFSIADFAGARELGARATLYLQSGVVLVAAGICLCIPVAATGQQSGQKYYPGKHDRCVGPHCFSPRPTMSTYEKYTSRCRACFTISGRRPASPRAG